MEQCSGTQADEGLPNSGGFQGSPGVGMGQTDRKEELRITWEAFMARCARGLHHSAHIPLARSLPTDHLSVYGEYGLAVWSGKRENPFDEVSLPQVGRKPGPSGRMRCLKGAEGGGQCPEPNRRVPTGANSTSDMNSQDSNPGGLDSKPSGICIVRLPPLGAS